MATPAPRPGSFLDVLGDDGRRSLREHATPRRFAKGSALLHAMQVPDRALVLLDGHVKLARETEDGREVMLGVRGPGDLLGEQGVLDGEPRSASAVALDDVEALALAAADFLGFLARTPAASLHVMRVLAGRLRDADAKRVEYAAGDTAARLAARLLELAERFGAGEDGGGVTIDLPLTQEDLAGWTGSSREAVARALSQMRGLGWLETSRRSITLHDLPALRSRAAG